MGRFYSEDLRRRVIAAIEDGVSTRAAARRFSIGESTAGTWHRLWRATGKCGARRQGQPPRSKLDAHEAFILALIADVKDITLVEIAGRLQAEHGISVCTATVWHFFSKRRISFKKKLLTQLSKTARTSKQRAKSGLRDNPVLTRLA
jgi:transposase